MINQSALSWFWLTLNSIELYAVLLIAHVVLTATRDDATQCWARDHVSKFVSGQSPKDIPIARQQGLPDFYMISYLLLWAPISTCVVSNVHMFLGMGSGDQEKKIT